MPKKYRLTGEEIRNLSGKRMHGKFFSLLIAPIRADHAKCTVVVSKKVAMKAVDRNTIKRRARSALAKHVPNVKKAVALVLYAKREAKGAAFKEIVHDIGVLFSKV
jgi:ribonuclease P protein component